ADAGGAVDLREADARRPGDLAVTGVAAQLEGDLVDLPEPRGPDRLAARQAAAVGVNGQPAVGPRRTALDERLLLAVLAQARLGEVHDLGPRLGVLQLRDLNVRGADARLLEGGGGRLGRRRGRRLDRDRRTEDLERAEAPRPEGHRAQEDGLAGQPPGALAAREDEGDGALPGRAEHVLAQRVVDHLRGED